MSDNFAQIIWSTEERHQNQIQGPMWSEVDPSQTMINREENIELNRIHDLETKLMKVRYATSRNSEKQIEEFPETTTAGKFAEYYVFLFTIS